MRLFNLKIIILCFVISSCAAFRQNPPEEIKKTIKLIRETTLNILIDVTYTNRIKNKISYDGILNETLAKENYLDLFQKSLQDSGQFKNINFGSRKQGDVTVVVEYGVDENTLVIKSFYDRLSILTLTLLPSKRKLTTFKLKGLILDKNNKISKKIDLEEKYDTWVSLFFIPALPFIGPYRVEKELAEETFRKFTNLLNEELNTRPELYY